jgi:L-fucose mutarotase
VQAVINASEGRDAPMGALERMAFYERAKTAYCIVATGEQRFYGCFILKKGVLPEPA